MVNQTNKHNSSQVEEKIMRVKNNDAVSMKNKFFQELTLKELESISGGSPWSRCITNSPESAIPLVGVVIAGGICTYGKILTSIF